MARGFTGSALLTSEHWGHGALGTSPCVDRAVRDYLLEGVLPEPGARGIPPQ